VDRKKILVVDDSKTALMMSKMILKQFPFEVITADNGEEGVSKAVSETPDLILLDVIMPKKNGFEALKELRCKDSTRNIPIIMVTTRSEAENVENGYESGCNDYITKPVSSEELIAKIKNLIN
jgi:DNA-binding response OmpR family regulator